jgi:hypothetical protein
MAMLREIAREMEQLTNAIERIGGQVPSQAIPYVYDFFDLADALLQQEVKSTTGSVSKGDRWVWYPSSDEF